MRPPPKTDRGVVTPRSVLILLKWQLLNSIEHFVSATPAVFTATPQTFQADVIDRSNEVPVIVLFWAEQMPETVSMRQVLDTQVSSCSDKLSLALVDVAADQAFAQSLAQSLGVQSVPSVRVIRDGQLLDQLDGPQTDDALIALCDRLTLSSADVLKEQLAVCLDSGDFESALTLLQRAIEEEPGNAEYRVELADILAIQGDLTGAKTALSGIDDSTPNIARPRARLEFAEKVEGLDSIEVLETKVAENSGDLESQYSLSVRYVCANRLEDALETALDILCADRKFRDDIGRLTMLQIFELLPKGSELASSFRRRMFNFMH